VRAEIVDLLASVKREGMQKLIKFLLSSDFFTAPASTKYHCAYEGGLALHSLNVYHVFKMNLKMFNIPFDEDSIKICGLLHDIGKVNHYKKVEKKSYYNGNTYETYEVDDSFPISHPEKSVYLIQKFITLSEEEICAIRWHMGVFDESQSNKYSMRTAFKKYPTAFLLFVSDYQATKILEENDKTYKDIE